MKGKAPKRARTEKTERAGVFAVASYFNNTLGWIFREQPTSDYGIDAHVELTKNDEISGDAIAVQIKCGESYFRGRGPAFVFRGKSSHLQYWLRYSVPVILILVRPKTGEMYWQKISAETSKVTAAGWSVEIPRSHLLDRHSGAALGDICEQHRWATALSVISGERGYGTGRFRFSHGFVAYQRVLDDVPGHDAADIQQAEALYAFNQELRGLMLDGLETIENEMRASFYFAMKCQTEKVKREATSAELFSPEWYALEDTNNLRRVAFAKRQVRDEARKWFLPVSKSIDTPAKRAEFEAKFEATLSSLSLEQELRLLSLSGIADLFWALRREVAVAMAMRFKLPVVVLRSMLYSFRYLKNVCVHRGPVSNLDARFGGNLMLFPKKYREDALINECNKGSIYGFCAAIRLLHDLISPPHPVWRRKLVALISNQGEPYLNGMGFPDNWRQSPFWQRRISAAEKDNSPN